jgi:hypothetical protein
MPTSGLSLSSAGDCVRRVSRVAAGISRSGSRDRGGGFRRRNRLLPYRYGLAENRIATGAADRITPGTWLSR